jgi:hypothetical protein
VHEQLKAYFPTSKIIYGEILFSFDPDDATSIAKHQSGVDRVVSRLIRQVVFIAAVYSFELIYITRATVERTIIFVHTPLDRESGQVICQSEGPGTLPTGQVSPSLLAFDAAQPISVVFGPHFYSPAQGPCSPSGIHPRSSDIPRHFR